MKTLDKNSVFDLKQARKTVEEQMTKLLEDENRKANLSPSQVESGYADYYLLIDMGFTDGQPFQPNSIQFYSNTKGFLCHKIVDNASLASLIPILNCKSVFLQWKTATREAIYVNGLQPK